VIERKNILFGSEMLGAVRGVDPETGHHFDDTKRFVDALALPREQLAEVYEGNARRVYPRLDATLKSRTNA
jgi:4-oxalmesaconate hydratase